MKNLFLKPTLLVAAILFLTACETETTTSDIQEIDELKMQADQFVSVKDVSNDPVKIEFAKNLLKEQENLTPGKRIGCTLDSDVGCGSDAIAEIEEYINLSGCISYAQGNLILPIQLREFTFNYSYYVDSDTDINMDQYQFQFDSHVANIASRIAPNKIALVSADAGSMPCRERTFNTAFITYTVILGN